MCPCSTISSAEHAGRSASGRRTAGWAARRPILGSGRGLGRALVPPGAGAGVAGSRPAPAAGERARPRAIAAAGRRRVPGAVAAVRFADHRSSPASAPTRRRRCRSACGKHLRQRPPRRRPGASVQPPHNAAACASVPARSSVIACRCRASSTTETATRDGPPPGRADPDEPRLRDTTRMGLPPPTTHSPGGRTGMSVRASAW